MRPYFPLQPRGELHEKYEEQQPGVYVSTKYKPVDQKINPVLGIIPDDFKIVRRIPEDPLLTLPPIQHPLPEFSPGVRLTQERWDKIEADLLKIGFLLPEEIKLFQHVLKNNEKGIAWDDSEKGQFRTDYFEPVKFPTVPHVPWVEKNYRIPPGMHEQLVKELQRKLDMGVIE
ncbi:hypothetical protein SISNIDRAFT_412528, partial [Sistotremastrum niveocremeum HHB9708]